MEKTNKTIALLTTGDEIINGDILNSNSQDLAHRLFSYGLQPGVQMSVCDAKEDITNALQHLTNHHDIVITTGGLGPTSDDITRFALAEFLGENLVFDDNSWTWILERHRQLALKTSDSNRQQCFFPQGATILDNPHGSANGCLYQHQDKTLVMLPGPPHECLPMFDTFVLPKLIENYASNREQLKWRLFGVSEGEIAHQLDEVLKEQDCQTAYRWEYPYIEFKVVLDRHHPDRAAIIALVEPLIRPHIISPHDRSASAVLKTALGNLTTAIVIDDRATGGMLASRLLTPESSQHVSFYSPHDRINQTVIAIEGLSAYWQQQKEEKITELDIIFHHQGTNTRPTQRHRIPYRHQRIREYACELLSYLLLQLLREEGLLSSTSSSAKAGDPENRH